MNFIRQVIIIIGMAFMLLFAVMAVIGIVDFLMDGELGNLL